VMKVGRMVDYWAFLMVEMMVDYLAVYLAD
jgi:hypothetical protein